MGIIYPYTPHCTLTTELGKTDGLCWGETLEFPARTQCCVLSTETLFSGDFDHVQHTDGETATFNGYLQKMLMNMLI